jgi:hypothetical protein
MESICTLLKEARYSESGGKLRASMEPDAANVTARMKIQADIFINLKVILE